MKNIGSIYKNYERHISSLALFGGFVFDILTLRRAGSLSENLWILMYLILSTLTIIVLFRNKKTEEENEINFWLVNILQFSFGGLLSAFLVLYFRSATLSSSWPFLTLLLITFLANEKLRRHYERLTYQLSLLFLAIFLFLIFFIPVLTGVIGPMIFLTAGLLSLLFMRVIVSVLEWVSKDRVLHARQSLRVSILSIFVLINIFYFTNIIPPIPLSLREGGVYQSVDREVSGDYVLKREASSWTDYLKSYPRVSIVEGQLLYAYTAIYSPAKFNLHVFHDWQYLNEETNTWERVSKIDLPISGGRNNGYRTYSILPVKAGKWRVNVLTSKGQVLGRLKFEVVVVDDAPTLIAETH